MQFILINKLCKKHPLANGFEADMKITTNKIFQLCLACLIFTYTLLPQTINKPPDDEYLFGDTLNPNASTLNPDYRNHKNIPEYDPSLMPLNYNNRSTGVWTELNPKVPRVNYIGIDFVDSLTGWAVGANGAIIKTTDGGKNWETKQSGVTNILTHVNSYNGSVVIAVGFGGKILRSSDAGETWNSITSTAVADLWRVQMLNDTLGWICGKFYHLYKTIDGGLTWQSASAGFMQDYWSLDFLNEDIGFISCGLGNLLKTTDGGVNWQQLNIGEDVSLYCVTMLDDRTIVTGGFTRIATTYDGGNTWHIVGLGGIFYSIAFSDSLNGTALSDALVYRTTDRGISWNSLFVSSSALNWVVFIDSLTGYYAGNGLRIQKTIDGGLTWKQLIFNDNFYDVHFINETTGFVLSGALYKTTDGGEGWVKKQAGLGGFSIKFIDSATGFIGNNNGSIQKTTNGGENWYAANSDPTAGQINKFLFWNDSVGWALGGKVLKTTNKGESWVVKGIGGTSIFFIDSLVGWITRVNGRPYKTTDGGSIWVEQTNLNIWESRDVFFNDVLKGFILESNKFYETTDGGLNWILKPELTGFSVAAKFSYYDSSVIFIIGYKTYRSVNGGTNWIDFNELTGTRVNSLNLLGTGLGYAVGEYGLILKYLDSVYVPVELISFQGKSINNIIILNWQTASEINNKGFEIERSESENQIWKTIRFIQGSGTTAQEHRYSYKEVLENPGKYYYRLKQIDYNGKYEYSPFVEVKINFPLNYSLSQNYPNPFNSTTNINFTIPIETAVKIKLYDITGSEINTLVNKEMKAGYYTIQLSTEGLSSGLYFYKITTGSGYTSVKKLIILK